MNHTPTELGNANSQFRYENPTPEIFDTFENTSGFLLCPWVFNEFSSICPVTGQPDWARIQCLIIPNKTCIESKSFKLYCNAYRQHGEFHEECVARWLNDIVTKINPHYCRVWAKFNVRGGISINPMKEHLSPELEANAVQREKALRLVEMYDRTFHWDYK